MPGFGRFARKKQPSSQEDAPAPASAPAAATATAAPAAASVGERPGTAFATFDNGDGDRPPTSGSHGFSAITNMFGGHQDVGDDANVGWNIDAAEAPGVAEVGGMDVGDQYDFGTMGGGGDGGFGMGEFGELGGAMEDEPQQQPAPPATGNDASGKLSSGVADATKPPAGADNASVGSGAGGGIGLRGLFAKKRAAAAPAAAAAENVPGAVEPATKKIDASQPPKNELMGRGAMNSIESSDANLSRFDTDLASMKDAENAAFGMPVIGDVAEGAANNAVGGENEKAYDANSGEVPATVPASGGDDVEDDLTEDTAATYATATMEGGAGAGGDAAEQTQRGNSNFAADEIPKTGPFVSDPANSQVAAQQQAPVAGDEQHQAAVSNNTSPYFSNAVEDQAVAQQGTISGEQQRAIVSNNTSPYFSNPVNNQVAAQQVTETENALGTQEKMGTAPNAGTEGTHAPSLENDPMETSADDNSPPHEEIVIPGITTAATATSVQTSLSSSKLGENLEAMLAPGAGAGAMARAGIEDRGAQESANTVEPMEVSKSDPKPRNGGRDGDMPSPHQGSTQRVSLSPPGLTTKQADTLSLNVPADVPHPSADANQAASLSPKGPIGAPRPSVDANQAASFSPNGATDASKGPVVGAPCHGFNATQVARLLPKGPVVGAPRPGPNANQATALSPKGPVIGAPRLGLSATQDSTLSPKGPVVGAPRLRLIVTQDTTLLHKGPVVGAPRPDLNATQAAARLSPKGPVAAPRSANKTASFLLKGRAEASRGAKKSASFLLKGRGETRRNANQAASFSPKGRVETNVNQNDIVIPGVSDAAANTNVERAKTMVAQLEGGATGKAGESAHAAKKDGMLCNFSSTHTGGGQGMNSLHQGSVQRVSLSPVTKHGLQCLPKDNVESALNQNSIMIPGVPTTMTNTNVEAQTRASGSGTKNESRVFPARAPPNSGPSANLQSANHQNRNSFGEANNSTNNFGANRFGQQTSQINNNSRILPANGGSGFDSSRQNHNPQKPSFMSNRNTSVSLKAKAPPLVNNSKAQNVHPNTTHESRRIDKFGFSSSNDAEKVKFTLPENHATDKNANNTSPMGSNGLEKNNGQFRPNRAGAPSSTAITPDHRHYQSNTQQQTAATPFARPSNVNGGKNNTISPTPPKTPAPTPAATAMQFDSTPCDRVFPGMPPAAEPKTMEVQPQVQENRPRSNTMYTPPPRTIHDSATPKVSNVHDVPATTVVNANKEAAPTSFHTNNSAFHTDETFDELLSQFVQDVQEGTDIHERGQNDLLEIDVDLSHAFAGVLRYKEGYLNLLDEIETMAANAEAIMAKMAE